MLKMLGWTVAVWTAAFLGAYGWAVTAAFFALMHGSLIALASLRRDKDCSMCGLPYDVGVLGMHSACARETRLVRR